MGVSVCYCTFVSSFKKYDFIFYPCWCFAGAVCRGGGIGGWEGRGMAVLGGGGVTVLIPA